jgi:hypothetical protein
VGRTEGAEYLVLELLEGGSLEDRVAAGTIPPEEARRLGAEIAEGLAAAHEAGILHRDLKSANVLLDAHGHAKLADFGLALFAGRRARTRTGYLVGTPEAMAPEILDGREAGGPVDIYALGCLLHQLCHGVSARQGSLREVLEQSAMGITPPREFAHELDPWIDRCLRVDPTERPTAREVAVALGTPPSLADEAPAPSDAPPPETRLLASSPSRAPGETVQVSAQDGSRPRRAGLLASGGALTLVLLGAWVGSSPAPPPSPAAPPPGTPSPSPAPSAPVAWARRDILSRLAADLGRVHGKVTDSRSAREGPAGRDYHASVHENLHGHDWPPRGRLDSILAAADLPFQLAEPPPVDELVAALTDSDLPPDQRAGLRRNLQALAAVDAYFRAWGHPEPYGVLGTFPGAALARVEERFDPPEGSRLLELETGDRPALLKPRTFDGREQEGYLAYWGDAEFMVAMGERRPLLEAWELRWEIDTPRPGTELVLDAAAVASPLLLVVTAEGPKGSTRRDFHVRREDQATKRQPAPQAPADRVVRLRVPEAPGAPRRISLVVSAATAPGVRPVYGPRVHRAWLQGPSPAP